MWKWRNTKLSELLGRDSNNLDLVRLILACVVVYGHSFVLSPDARFSLGGSDFIACRVHFEGLYSGSTAVKVFFFISGLLVTNSLMRTNSAVSFLISRGCRLWPALIGVLLVTVYLVGPLATELSAKAYWQNPETHQYLWRNLTLRTTYNLPGVFNHNVFPKMVNGVLWTLQYEAGALAILLGLHLLRITRSMLAMTAILFLIMLDPLLPHPVLLAWIPENPQMSYLAPSFALGAFLALNQEKISISWMTVLGAVGAFFLLNRPPLGPYAFYFAVMVSLLYFSSLPFVRRCRLPFDASYGVYLWGFVVQQVVASHFGSRGLVFNLCLSLGITLIIGILSWHLVERPAVDFGRRLCRKWISWSGAHRAGRPGLV